MRTCCRDAVPSLTRLGLQDVRQSSPYRFSAPRGVCYIPCMPPPVFVALRAAVSVLAPELLGGGSLRYKRLSGDLEQRANRDWPCTALHRDKQGWWGSRVERCQP